MVGPWAWAARIRREKVLVSTAMLAGFEFKGTRPLTAYYGVDGLLYREPIPNWLWAESWLSTKGIKIDGTE